MAPKVKVGSGCDQTLAKYRKKYFIGTIPILGKYIVNTIPY